MGDMENAVAECRRAQSQGLEISDACARVIASLYHSGGNSFTATLASTGEIRRAATAGGLCRELFGPTTYSSLSADERLMFDMMGTYLLSRLKAGRRTVEGWSGLWL